MDNLFEVLRGTAYLLIYLLHTAMFIRAIMSWFPMAEGKFSDFLFALTEPVIYPVRVVFDKLGIGSSLPLDIPFFVTFLLLSFISMLL